MLLFLTSRLELWLRFLPPISVVSIYIPLHDHASVSQSVGQSGSWFGSRQLGTQAVRQQGDPVDR